VDKLPCTHVALDDAIEEGALFCDKLSENGLLERSTAISRRQLPLKLDPNGQPGRLTEVQNSASRPSGIVGAEMLQLIEFPCAQSSGFRELRQFLNFVQ
jgi:hypothetical protein